jgi:hypothetical protein
MSDDGRRPGSGPWFKPGRLYKKVFIPPPDYQFPSSPPFWRCVDVHNPRRGAHTSVTFRAEGLARSTAVFIDVQTGEVVAKWADALSSEMRCEFAAHAAPRFKRGELYGHDLLPARGPDADVENVLHACTTLWGMGGLDRLVKRQQEDPARRAEFMSLLREIHLAARGDGHHFVEALVRKLVTEGGEISETRVAALADLLFYLAGLAQPAARQWESTRAALEQRTNKSLSGTIVALREGTHPDYPGKHTYGRIRKLLTTLNLDWCRKDGSPFTVDQLKKRYRRAKKGPPG